MSKNRKKVFPKKPEPLTQANSLKLGRGSNNHPWANSKAIYLSEKRQTTNINDWQKEQLLKLRKKLGVL